MPKSLSITKGGSGGSGITKFARTRTLVVAASNAKDTTNYDYLCTGTSDNTTIATAIAALPAAGGIIQLTDGLYSVSGEIQITASNIGIQGQGTATTIKVANSANIRSAIAVVGSNITYDFIKDLQIDGNKTNQSSGSGIYIKTPGSSFSGHVFQDLLVQNCKNDGIKTDNNAGSSSMYFLRVHAATCNGNGFNIFQDVNGASLTDSIFDTCIADTNALNGMYIGCIDTHFINCKTYYNGSTAGNNHGYYIAGYNNYFENCEAQDNYQSGFYSQNDGDATYGSQNCVFINCDGDSNNQAQGVLYGNGFQLKNVTGWILMGTQAYVRPYASAWGQKFGVSLEGTTNKTQITNLQGTGNIGAPAPGVATAATAAGTTLGVGVYRYKITFVTAAGETAGGTEFTITTTTSNTNVSLTTIPTGGSGVTKRRIYRTQVGGATATEKLVTTIADNTTTTYTDNNSDASITGNAAVPTVNTTALLYLNASSGGGNVLYGLNAAGTRIIIDGGGNDLEYDNMPELFWNATNPDISLFSSSDNRLDILNAGGGKGNLNVQNQITFGYGDYLGVSPNSSWPSGTHKLLEVTFGSQDQVDIYTPGGTLATSLMTLTADKRIKVNSGVTFGLPSAGVLVDVNNNTLLATLATVGSSVDYVTLTNSATGNPALVGFSATGSDSNIHFQAIGKGNGLTKISILRQDDTSNTYKHNSVVLSGWGIYAQGAAANKSETVTFGITFAQRPIVLATYGGDATSLNTTYGSGGNTDKGPVCIKAHTITTTTFIPQVHTADGTSWVGTTNVFYQWLAVGEL